MRHDHDTIRIGNHDISRIYRYAASGDRHVHVDCVMFCEIERCACPGTPQRQAESSVVPLSRTGPSGTMLATLRKD